MFEMRKRQKIYLAAIFVLIAIIVIVTVLLMVVLWNKENEDLTRDITKYESYIGDEGRYKRIFDRYNDIFPNTIPETAEIENFYYHYYNPWDACCLGYLIYTCDEKDYEKEYKRLKKIESSEDKYIYGATSFPYELCAVYTDPYYGYIYAMTDKDSKKFIYVQIEFCNYVTDIDYESVVLPEHLPVGFDANPGNATELSEREKEE